MGRGSDTERKRRLLQEAKILADNPNISDIKMVEELAKYGIETTRQTVHSDKALDLEAMSMTEISESKSAMIKEIDTLIEIAYNRATSGDTDSLRAMDKYDKLFNTKSKVLLAFERAKMTADSSERPIINVSIGKPKVYDGDKKNEKKPIE